MCQKNEVFTRSGEGTQEKGSDKSCASKEAVLGALLGTHWLSSACPHRLWMKPQRNVSKPPLFHSTRTLRGLSPTRVGELSPLANGSGFLFLQLPYAVCLTICFLPVLELISPLWAKEQLSFETGELFSPMSPVWLGWDRKGCALVATNH